MDLCPEAPARSSLHAVQMSSRTLQTRALCKQASTLACTNTIFVLLSSLFVFFFFPFDQNVSLILLPNYIQQSNELIYRDALGSLALFLSFHTSIEHWFSLCSLTLINQNYVIVVVCVNGFQYGMCFKYDVKVSCNNLWHFTQSMKLHFCLLCNPTLPTYDTTYSKCHCALRLSLENLAEIITNWFVFERTNVWPPTLSLPM